MTMIYAGNDMLQKKMVLYKMVMALTCVSSVMLMFIGTPLSMAAAILLFLVARKICSNRSSIYAAGSRGENQVLEWLRELPDNYHVFTNVRVHERMEADAVVAGPAGLFLVEVKNYAGGLEGTSADDSWLQHKRNRQGKSYIKEIRNPPAAAQPQYIYPLPLLKTGRLPCLAGCLHSLPEQERLVGERQAGKMPGQQGGTAALPDHTPAPAPE